MGPITATLATTHVPRGVRPAEDELHRGAVRGHGTCEVGLLSVGAGPRLERVPHHARRLARHLRERASPVEPLVALLAWVALFHQDDTIPARVDACEQVGV